MESPENKGHFASVSIPPFARVSIPESFFVIEISFSTRFTFMEGRINNIIDLRKVFQFDFNIA
jgi:hypothetical protein